MSLLKYIWRNCLRNKLRSLLTAMSISTGVALVTLLYGYLAMQDFWQRDVERFNRIVVMSDQGFVGALPIAHLDKIRKLPGVEAAIPFTWFGGNYQAIKTPFAQFATDANDTLKVWNEYSLSDEQLADWKRNRTGCIASRELAERWKWQVGQRIRLEGQYYPFSLDLELCGLFDAPRYSNSLLFHWEYLDQEVHKYANDRAGNAGFIYAKVQSADQVASLAKSIDQALENTQEPTMSQSESAFSLMFVNMLGNIRAFINAIALTVAIALMLVAANTLAMSTRERRSELAVLKAIGFSRQRVFSLVVGESTLIAGLGTMTGVGVALALLQLLHKANTRTFPVGVEDFIGSWVLGLIAVAISLAALSSLVPAAIASRATVIDVMRAV